MSRANENRHVGRSPVVCAVFLSATVFLLAALVAPTAATSLGTHRSLPDIDINDDYANMSGNQLSIDVEPGDVDVLIGYFQVYAAGPSTNVDPWDGPGTESILDLQYYNPTTGQLIKIPADGVSTPVSFWVGPIEILLDGTMGDTLILDGPPKLYRLRVAEVPLGTLSGTYIEQHPGYWVPGDGTVPICCRGVDSGLGWLPGEVGPGIVYDPEAGELSELMDYFHLSVFVAPMIDVEFEEVTTWSEAGDPGTVLCDSVTVCNTGNVEVTDVHFEVSNLVGATYGGVIPSSSVGFDPASLTIPVGECDSLDLCVAIPMDMRADTYTGVVYLLADGETQFDELTIEVIVNCVPAMEVSADVTPVVLVDGAGSKVFEVCNLGNCDLTGVGVAVIGLPAGIAASGTIPPVIGWGECEYGTVDIAADSWLEAGIYHGIVTITADGGLMDSFPITVIMPELPGAEFAEDVIELNGAEGDTIDSTVIVENTGNVDLLPGVFEFSCEDLIGDGGDWIPGGLVEVDSDIGIPLGGSAEFPLSINLPSSLPDSLYTGTMGLFLEGEFLDEIVLRIHNDDTPVECAFYAALTDNGTVMLRWISGSLDSVEALSMFRATSPGGPYIRINNDPLPPTSPGRYEDTTVWPETTFWYELRAILLDGSEDIVGPALASVTTGGRLAAQLYPVSPNPSTGVVTVQFDVPSGGGPLALEIHNSRGQLVKSLVEHHPGRGRHTVTWDGTDLRGRHVSSGVYFARLVAGQAISAQKLIVIR